MILDAAQITLGIVLGLMIVASVLAIAIVLWNVLMSTRPAWWMIRARLAIRRARPTRAGR